MKHKRVNSIVLAIFLAGITLLISCGTGSNGTLDISVINIYEQVRSDAASGYLDKAKANWMKAIMNANTSEKLSEDLIHTIEGHDILLTTLPCFILPDELSSKNMLDFCDNFCWMFYDICWDDYTKPMCLDDYNPNPLNFYPAEVVTLGHHGPLFLMEKQTVEKMASEIFGFQKFALDERALVERRDSMCKNHADYEDFLRNSNAFCYIPHDPDPPALIYKSERSLGNGFFYIVFEQGWFYDGEEPYKLQDLHLVIRVADNFLGYEVVSVLQNGEGSLLQTEGCEDKTVRQLSRLTGLTKA
jgi:hypothetical protein